MAHKTGTFIAGIVVTLLGHTAVAAEVLKVHETGTIIHDAGRTSVNYNGLDTTGVFGAPNTLLTGDSFSLDMLFDTTLLAKQTYTGGNGSVIYSGGTDFGSPSPSLGATLTINGTQFHFGGAAYGVILVAGDPTTSYAAYRADDRSNDGAHFVNNTLVAELGAPIGSITTTSEGGFYYVPPTPQYGGEFWTQEYYEGVPGVATYTSLSSGTFQFDTFSALIISGAPDLPPIPANAVPEPATWAMLLIGFGFIVATLRSNRRATNAAA